MKMNHGNANTRPGVNAYNFSAAVMTNDDDLLHSFESADRLEQGTTPASVLENHPAATSLLVSETPRRRSRDHAHVDDSDNMEDLLSGGRHPLTSRSTNDLASAISTTEPSFQRIPDGTPTRPKSLSRRRGLATSSPARSTVTVSTVSTTTSSSFRPRPAGTASTNNRSETIEEETHGGGGGLRASLDAGMDRVRRWIRSRPPQQEVTDSFQAQRGRSTTDFPHGGGLEAAADADDSHDGESSSNDDGDDLLDLPGGPHHWGEDGGGEGRFSNRDVSHSNSVDNDSPRQRALSEPDGVHIRDLLFQRAFQRARLRGGGARRRPPPTGLSQQQLLRRRDRGRSVELVAVSSSQVLASVAEVVYASTTPLRSADSSFEELESLEEGELRAIESPARVNSATAGNASSILDNSIRVDPDSDPQRQARNRWITINRRFQVVITMVALIFSILLFAILVCWVVLTSAYVVSIDKTCDVPLKYYYWFVTLQLIVDVFRTEIMRLFFRWDANSNQRIPCRVITYNVAYLTYALMVLRMGVNSVFLNKETSCPSTAQELFETSTAFVTLSILAWSTIILGYLVPFCVVAALLTWNGYTPTSLQPDGSATTFTVFPTAMGAPPGFVDEMPIVMLEDFPTHYPMECCICMENFTGTDVIVETGCQHVFHKQCCRDWLRQARTCPVCRTDVPTSLEGVENNEERRATSPSGRLGFGRGPSTFVGRNDIHHEVSFFLQILRRRERRQQRTGNPDGGMSPAGG